MATEQFKSEVRSDIHLISLPSSLNSGMESALESSVKVWAGLPVALHVLDFSGTVNLDPSYYRVFTNFKQALKAANRFLASVNMRNSVLSEVRSAGVLSVFSPVANLALARTMAGLPGGKMRLDVQLLEPFVQATIHMMKTQVQLDLSCGKPFLKRDQDLPVEIAGLITLQNSDLPGSIALCFSRDIFLKIYEMMVGEKHEVISKEIEDAASEILNIIFGQAKTVLLQKGIRLERAIPTVLAGSDVKQRLREKGPAIVLPFTSSIGPFHMEVVLSA